MPHVDITLQHAELHGIEGRVIAMLRAWQEGAAAQADICTDLTDTLGPRRAAICLAGFEQVLALLQAHGYAAPKILSPHADEVSPDEVALARFVRAATEQRREEALADALFLVGPCGLLPFLGAAARFGLPLLCETCRLRGRCPAARTVRH